MDNDRIVWIAREILPHEPALRSWLRARPTAGLEVDDVIQEAYAILAALSSTGEIRNPRAYLFSVARSVVLQHVRRARIVSIEAMAGIEDLCISDTDQQPDRVAGRSQKLRLVAELIGDLPHKCRQAFVLRKVHGLSQKEIAGQMGIAESTVEKHIARGLNLIMGWIAELGEPAEAAPVPVPASTTIRKRRNGQTTRR